MSDYDGSGDDYASLRSKRNSGGSSHERSTTRDYKGRSSRVGGGRGNSNNGYDYDRRQRRGYDRHRDYDHGRDRRPRHRMRSRSRERSENRSERERSENRSRSPSSSRSRTKSKRTSGFDMAPPAAAVVPGAAIPGQMLTAAPGGVQNILPFANAQLSLPLMPAQAMTQQATRHARRVYVGGLPPTANEQTIATFFSGVMTAIGGNSSGSGDAVVNVYINHEKKFAFVEMRTVEEASNAMALDGIIFEGVAVRVRRPTDYNPALAATLGPSQPSPHLNLSAVGVAPGSAITGAEGPERIFVGGLPYYFTEAQIRELLESFGPLRGFDLVKDKDTGNSKGYGFCVYQDPAVTDIACGALNGLKMGDKTLTVRRATLSNSGQSKLEQDNILAQAQQHIAIQKMALQAGGIKLPEIGMTLAENAGIPSKILCLTEAINADQLKDNEEYEEIIEDMREECGKFGIVVNVIIPRPDQTGEPIPGVGKVFLEYSDAQGCANARNVLNGRKFGGNIVRAVSYPEDRYYCGDYSA